MGRLQAGGMLPAIDAYIFSRHALVNSLHLLDTVADEMGVSVASVPSPSAVRPTDWPITVVSNISERVKTRRQQIGGIDALKCNTKVDTMGRDYPTRTSNCFPSYTLGAIDARTG
jgi:hypothetical protein